MQPTHAFLRADLGSGKGCKAFFKPCSDLQDTYSDSNHSSYDDARPLAEALSDQAFQEAQVGRPAPQQPATQASRLLPA
jgi:hypothetical protein